MPLYEFEGKRPTVHPDAFIAPTATLIGDVTVEEGASIWYGAVLRADICTIVVGEPVPTSRTTRCCTPHPAPAW